MRIASAGHAAFSLLLIGIGIQGLITGDFTTVWQPVPIGVPAREALAYLCAVVSIGSGVGLLSPRTAGHAGRALLVVLLLWLAAWRVSALFRLPLIEGSWSLADTMVMAAGAWILYAWFAPDWDQQHVRFAVGSRGVRIATVLYGAGLIPFGYAHFANLQGTAALVPRWLPWPVGWAYVTGGAFVAAGVAIVIGVCGRWAAALSAVQIGLFGLLVWVPMLVAGPRRAFQWMEFATTLALTAAAWVVADSYRRAPPITRLRGRQL
ncbi:MAG TPA: hypothetical protein VFA27_17425 [Vicinamibacterales bacterium]|nr:hypothetical protein [Vicinamibacterales bacterium]